MKIGFNISPLKNAHRDRGIGNYSYKLLEQLKKNNDISIQEFIHQSELKDVNAIHYPWFDFFFSTLTKIKRIPTVVTVHDIIPLKYKENYPVGLKGKVNLFFQKRELKKCNAVITDSQSSKKDIINFLGISAEKISVIPLAADDDFKILPESRLIHIRRKYNLTNRFILYVGDANWVKNLPFLINSFKSITDKGDFKDLKLVLVGGVFLKKVENIDHPELESLKKVNSMIKDLNLEDKVIRVGKLEKDDLVCFYNLANLYVQPSFYEGFGLPLLEAMSCGVPVLSSNGGALPEVGGEAVVYFNSKNNIQFESLVEEILSNKSLQQRLSKLGLKQAKNFSWQKVAEQTIKVYYNVSNI